MVCTLMRLCWFAAQSWRRRILFRRNNTGGGPRSRGAERRAGAARQQVRALMLCLRCNPWEVDVQFLQSISLI